MYKALHLSSLLSSSCQSGRSLEGSSARVRESGGDVAEVRKNVLGGVALHNRDGRSINDRVVGWLVKWLVAQTPNAGNSLYLWRFGGGGETCGATCEVSYKKGKGVYRGWDCWHNLVAVAGSSKGHKATAA